MRDPGRFFGSLPGKDAKPQAPAGAPEAGSPAAAGPRRVARPEPPPALAGPYRKGDRIGQGYVVLGVLGAGGFGVVYLAQNSYTNEKCALKTFHERFLADAAAREAFKKEAILWVGLEEHPFILAARWVEEVSGRLFVEMDYVAPDGEGRVTLEDHLTGGVPVKAGQALAWAIQFCHGMEYASANGLRCHRDIKPGNVLIASSGMLKITDFGLAAAAEGAWRAGGQGGSLVSAGQGRVGLSMVQSEGGGWCGTPGYIAPEVYEGKGSDVRSDVYGFGLVLWQMAAGSPVPPFHAAEVRYRGDAEAYAREYQAKVYEKQRAGKVPPVDGPLGRVMGRCLAYRPSERYGNFRELREALEPLYHGLTGRSVEVPRIDKTAAFWTRKGASLGSLGRYDEALRCHEKALEIDPRCDHAWNNKGNSLLCLGRYDEAIRCFEKALDIDPRVAAAWNNKGASLHNLGRHDEAIRCYDKALEIDPRDAKAWNNKGGSLGSLGQYDEALRCHEKALEIDPRDANAWNNKGNSLNRLSRYDEALRCYEKALEIDPRNAYAWYSKALAEESLGRRDATVAAWRAYLALARDDPSQKDRISEVEEHLRRLERG